MKITKINLGQVKEGKNPFYTAEWADASIEKKAQVFGILSKIGNSRIIKSV